MKIDKLLKDNEEELTKEIENMNIDEVLELINKLEEMSRDDK